jgi:aspartate/methionine/tyrosine aminotransferase
MNRVMSSAYMEWAKLHSASRFNLAVSGMPSYPLSKLPVKLEDLELSRGGAYGYAPLQAALAAHCGIEKENVVTAAGTSMANLLALTAILEPGDQALVEHPTYELLLAALGFLQADVRRFERTPETGFALNPQAIERAITTRTKVIVLTNLHNPSSALADQATLRAVGEIARGVGARVLVDEVYLDAVFDDTPPTAFHLGPEFVVTNSLTKVYGLSGLRCGWILAEPGLARRIWQLDDLFDVNPAHVAERLSCLALANLGPIRARSRALLDANRPLLNQFFATRSDLGVRPLESGTVAFPRLLSGPVDRLCDLLRSKYEATVVPGSFFEMPQHFRIGIATETSVLIEGLRRLSCALDEECPL